TGERRRRLGSFLVTRGGGIDGKRRGITGRPDLLAGVGVERGERFVVASPREHVEAIADENRRRIANPDVDLPLSREGVGPCLRRRERRDCAVAVGSAPLRPVGARLGAQSGRCDDQNPGSSDSPRRHEDTKAYWFITSCLCVFVAAHGFGLIAKTSFSPRMMMMPSEMAGVAITTCPMWLGGGGPKGGAAFHT